MAKSKTTISVKGSDGEFKELRPDHILSRVLNGTDKEKTIEIKGAVLKDDFCNYSYEFISGIGEGDSVDRKGSNIIHSDLKDAFKKLHAHLALICEEIDADTVTDVEAIAEYDEENYTVGSIEYLVSRFFVSGFKITSTGENESVILVGSKMLSTGDFVELKSPKTGWNGEYHFINELRAAIDNCPAEVEQYMNGKSAPKYVQTGIEFPDKNEDDDQE